MSGVLNGLRVIEGSAFVAAPTCGMTLAQMGADVIRFDMVGGGIDYRRWPVMENGNSIYWAGMNKGKRSIAVDFRKPEGQELLTELITQPGEGRGILLTNFPMRGWLDYETLKGKRDDLIALNIIGNPDGSVAVDYTVNAAVGFPFVTGPDADTNPVNHVLPGWDVSTGFAAATGLLGAERHRTRTGEGQYVSLSLADMAFATVGNLGYIGEVQMKGESRPNIGNDVYGSYGRDFATADGRRVMIIAVSVHQWKKLLEATHTGEKFAALEAELGMDFTLEEHRYAAREAINKHVGTWCAAHRLNEIRTIFDEHNVCWGPYQTFEQMVAEDPRASTANPLFREINQPGIGRYIAAGTPNNFTAVPRTVPRAPLLGEHTDEILSGDLGLSDGEIGKLHDTGVVAGPETT
ncbi:MAG: 2-methylfumaryl-CoA isomerase [Alphaproteobacteria bacterium]|nr:2-methylfumaryl-CoA isomerase [Alphaproteobacteria bacterium]HCP00037.1 2-methylfumaryl-CoA isomerase [Rhodospirillaceae bacterium]